MLFLLFTLLTGLGLGKAIIGNLHHDHGGGVGLGLQRSMYLLHSDPGSRPITTTTADSNFAFTIYWGLACNCSEIGIDLDLENWGIHANKNQGQEKGEVFNAFHRNDFEYPYIDDDGKFINDGLPQARKLKEHLEAATVDIIRKIPNPEFNGLAIIDWEKWSPLLDQNWDARTVYKTASINLVRQRLRNYDNKTIETVARVEFEEAAQGLMQGVLKLGKALRPNATWGFYHYPYCHNKDVHTNYACLQDTVATNDKMTWLFDESSALFPSIYLRPYIKDNYDFVEARLRETVRVVSRLDEPGKQVYVYNRFNYSGSSLYYNIDDIKMSIRKAATLSFDGIVLWGDFNSLNNSASCTQLKRLLASTYGPALLNTKSQAESCSRKMCSGYGRCSLNDSVLRNATGDVFWKWQSLEFIKCRCLTGWAGTDCSRKSNM